MREFRVGDRVIGCGVESRLDITGCYGEIIAIENQLTQPILVKFDKRFSPDLHSDDNKCWYVEKDSIELATNTEDKEDYEYSVDLDALNKLIS